MKPPLLAQELIGTTVGSQWLLGVISLQGCGHWCVSQVQRHGSTLISV